MIHARHHAGGLHVWPALTDLMAGIALTVLVVLVIAYAQGARDRHAVATLHARLAELEADLDRTKEKLAEAQRRLGVGPELVARIEQRLAADHIQARVNQYGNLEVSADVLFDMGEALIPPDKEAAALQLGRVVFDLLADEGQARAIALLTVVGHTDQVGTDENNRSLSTRRALALVDLWHARLPVPEAVRACVAAKLVVAGLGEARPLVSSEGPAACHNGPGDRSGCRANRRIEIRITPKEEGVAEVPGCS